MPSALPPTTPRAAGVNPGRRLGTVALDADVLAVQEVDRFLPRSAHADLTAVAAEAMGATEHRFVAALAGSPGASWIAATGEEQPESDGYGIALLSRYPVTGWEVVRLGAVPTPVPMWFRGSRRPVLLRDEPRVAVAATICTPHGVVTVVNTHLTFLTWWNGRQLHNLVSALQPASRPLLLMGDLNLGPARAQALTRMRPLATHRTFPSDRPRAQIDHILVDGDLRARCSEARALPLSDHRALVVDVD